MVALGLDEGGLFPELGAGGEIGEALELEELRGGVVAGLHKLTGGGHDGVVDFIGGGDVAGLDGVEGREGEFFAADDVGVDFFEAGVFGPEAFERAAGDVEAEAAFGTRLADAGKDSVVGLAVERVGDLLEFAVGKRSEGEL